jgi:hypothetical protein
MKFRCKCNHIIVDQTDYLSYKAEFTLDKDSEDLTVYLSEIDNLIDAISNNSEEEWIKGKFGESYPNQKYSSYIFDLITRTNTRHIYECIKCGRLHVETKNGNYSSYKLEEGEKGIFEK